MNYEKLFTIIFYTPDYGFSVSCVSLAFLNFVLIIRVLCVQRNARNAKTFSKTIIRIYMFTHVCYT